MAGEGLLAAALIVLLGSAVWRLRNSSAGYASDPPSPFYHPFTTEFDRECKGAELLGVLERFGRDVRAASSIGASDPAERLQQFEDGHAAGLAEAFPSADLSGTAICILVDQSGSMAATMPRLAGELLAACERLEQVGALTMLAGFTTVGWKGGRSRELWLRKGRPRYPGRLCDLLHIIYSDFGEPSAPALLAPLLAPAVFFENVDGEAIEWAEAQLQRQTAARRCLIVVSDGAPVDDSTLSANGPSFLWNHLESTIAGVIARGQIALGAVGIGHRVEGLYPTARQVQPNGVGQLAAAIGAMAVALKEPLA